MHIASIGIDIGKTTFHLVALNEHGSIVVRKKFSRSALMAYTANLSSSLIGMETCGGAHFLARAASRKNMRFVPVPTDEQLDLQGLHRVRARLVRNRTIVINQIRGFLLERGICFPKGILKLRKEMPALLEDAEQQLTPSIRALLDHLWQEWKYLDHQVEQISGTVDAIAESDDACQRLRQIPGVGPLVSTATVAAIGNGAAFSCGRDFAAWLGLVPKQYSTGDKPLLLGISKRGNNYLRTLFVHGARAVLFRVKYDTGALGKWVQELAQRAPRNKVIVAIANKIARVAWAVLSSGEQYRQAPANAPA